MLIESGPKFSKINFMKLGEICPRLDEKFGVGAGATVKAIRGRIGEELPNFNRRNWVAKELPESVVELTAGAVGVILHLRPSSERILDDATKAEIAGDGIDLNASMGALPDVLDAYNVPVRTVVHVEKMVPKRNIDWTKAGS